jgi:beta-galactosidase
LTRGYTIIFIQYNGQRMTIRKGKKGMQNKKFKKIGAVILAAAMILQSFGGMAGVSAAESTQMSSEKEVVYANVYSDAVREQNFDANWKFYLGAASGAEATNYDDSAWENVSLPHDYSIEQEYTSAGEAESGYLLGGTGW